MPGHDRCSGLSARGRLSFAAAEDRNDVIDEDPFNGWNA